MTSPAVVVLKRPSVEVFPSAFGDEKRLRHRREHATDARARSRLSWRLAPTQTPSARTSASTCGQMNIPLGITAGQGAPPPPPAPPSPPHPPRPPPTFLPHPPR